MSCKTILSHWTGIGWAGRRLLFLVCALLILSAESLAQTGPTGGDASVVFRGSFDVSTDVNHDAWPDRWTRRRGRGYPTYIPVEIVDDDQPRSQDTNRCLRIRMDGGAAQVFTPRIQVTPQFSFELEAYVRCSGLKHDVVSCSLAFYDGREQLLETHETSPIREANTWTKLHLGPVTPSSDLVRSAVLSVHVRPTETSDLEGTVYIDDLVLSRLPKMSVEMGGDYQVYTDREVSVTCRVSGFMQDNPRVKFELLDFQGESLGVHEQLMVGDGGESRSKGPRNIASSGPGLGFRGSASWKPEVPGIGFYQIRVSTPGHAGRTVSFVVAPALSGGGQSEFGWSLPYGERPLSIKALPSLLSQAGVGWVKFPVWFNGADTKRAEELAWFAERLSTYQVKMVGVLDQPPPELCAAFGPDDQMPIATLFQDRAVWYPALDPVFTRLSLKVRWWQLGRDDDTSFGGILDLDNRVREIRDDLTTFGQQVKIGLPWRMLNEPPPILNPSWSFLSYVDEFPYTTAEIESYFRREDTSRSDKWIMLRALSAQDYNMETRIRHLLQSMLAAKIANARGIFLDDPFHRDHGIMSPDGSPSALLLPWRTAAMLLGGAEHLGSIKLPNGSENHIFVRDRRGIMVVWNEQPVTETTYLGKGIKLYDAWGNQSDPQEAVDDEFREQVIPVGPMPTFITGIDLVVAQWRMNFQLKTQRLASIFGHEQSISYQFKNTLPQAVAGKMSVHFPTTWTSDRVVRPFKVGAQGVKQDSFAVGLGPDASSGTQPLRVEFELTADQNVSFRLWESIEIGLGDVLVELDCQLDEQGNLVVEQHLINNTSKLISFNCLLYVPERRREKRQVFDLGQGRSTNRFILANGKELIGKTLWLRAEEINGARILNEKIVAHE